MAISTGPQLPSLLSCYPAFLLSCSGIPLASLLAIQSIPPGKFTAPHQSRKINLHSPLSNEALQSHLRIVLYYSIANTESDQGEFSATAVAGWMKESMSVVLSEYPVLAGRLRRGNENDGYWEVKYNDAGVRLVQASLEMKMNEFMELEDRVEKEGVLAHWTDVELEHPEISALFYIQVTEFEGDGYSIGISCSLLLADPTSLTQFLKRWAVCHNSMLAQAHPKTPIFHLDHFTKTKCRNNLRSIPLDSFVKNPSTATALFKVSSQTPKIGSGSLISYCIKEAAESMKASSGFSKCNVITNEMNGELRIESWKKEEMVDANIVCDGVRSVEMMEEYGLDELALVEGNNPVDVSCRVVSCEEEGLVIVNDDLDVLISITLPKL